MKEPLYTCPVCHRRNFTAADIRKHHCRANGRKRLNHQQLSQIQISESEPEGKTKVVIV